MTKKARRKIRPNPGWFRKGPDPRRHPLTIEERRRGGAACARKFTCIGRWSPTWWDDCRAKKKGEY